MPPKTPVKEPFHAGVRMKNITMRMASSTLKFLVRLVGVGLPNVCLSLDSWRLQPWQLKGMSGYKNITH